LVVGLGSGSIYRIIQICVPYLPCGEGRVTIGVGDKGPFLQRMSVRLGSRLHIVQPQNLMYYMVNHVLHEMLRKRFFFSGW